MIHTFHYFIRTMLQPHTTSVQPNVTAPYYVTNNLNSPLLWNTIGPTALTTLLSQLQLLIPPSSSLSMIIIGLAALLTSHLSYAIRILITITTDYFQLTPTNDTIGLTALLTSYLSYAIRILTTIITDYLQLISLNDYYRPHGPVNILSQLCYPNPYNNNYWLLPAHSYQWVDTAIYYI